MNYLINNMFKKIFQFLKDIAPSRETLVRTAKRTLSAGFMSALTTFVLIPVNLNEPKKYIYSVILGCVSGFLQGVVKFISGYIKYDLKD